ncbi:uncharacterized protein LOC132722095 [Ruditapes philippinarum]|uniref:uncharacterized protein LOC132722095 n=1 Tax=Ruditapes philippinarum TaxID=129788 RepID=UPI00295B8AB2|nr:uncharacterized protein LOC132722095 [Ruditapes philippinarum]
MVDKQQAEMDLLKQANIELKQENLQLNYDNTELKSRVNELELDVSRLKDEEELLQSERIAFHVYLSSSKCFNDHQIIEYDTEVLDTGNGYNEHDGIYIVPESGIYVFTWTFTNDIAEYAITEIVVNGETQGWTIADGSGQRLLYNPSSGLVLARVNAGDHVFIRRVEGRGCTAYSGQYVQPTFSGWQLSP